MSLSKRQQQRRLVHKSKQSRKRDAARRRSELEMLRTIYRSPTAFVLK